MDDNKKMLPGREK